MEKQSENRNLVVEKLVNCFVVLLLSNEEDGDFNSKPHDGCL